MRKRLMIALALASMSLGLRSLQVWSGYLLVVGAVLVLVPNLLLRLFGIAETTEVWLRVASVVVIALGILDASIVRRRDEAALWSTVYARWFGGVALFVLAFTAGLWQLSSARWTCSAQRGR